MFKMFRRFFWLVLGFALGSASSFAVTRRLRRVAGRYVPAEVADRFRTNVRAAVSEGRSAMRVREAELRGTAASVRSK